MKAIKKAVVWGIILLLFCGCSDKAANFQTHHPFTGQMTVSGAIPLEGELTRELIGRYRLTVTKPEILRGLTMMVQDGGVTLGWKGLTDTIPRALSADTPLLRVAGALDTVARGAATVTYTDSHSVIYTGEWMGQSFCAAFDRQTQLPTALEFEDQTKVTFLLTK